MFRASLAGVRLQRCNGRSMRSRYRGLSMPRLVFAGLVSAALMLLATGTEAGAQGYDYPFINAFEATVIGTPSIYAAELPDQVPKQEAGLTLFPERRTPEIFWYHDQLRYSVVRQRKKAPLIFIIAGTGASHNARSMQVMEKAFYQAGYHVISLPSPTHPNFITTASQTQVPGLLADDARDLYRVMQAAYEEVAPSIEVSDFYVTGYSLGGAHAAFVAKLDEQIGAFGFKKALMINPPVSLYNSVAILDDMINAIPGGPDNFHAFHDSLIERFAAIYVEEDFLDFTDDFLYLVYKKRPPTEEDLKAVVGLAFRLASANLLFTSDVLTRSGLVVRRNVSLSSTDSLTNYFKVSVRVGFVNYIDHLLYPFFKRQRPDVSLEQLIEESSLYAIEDYLRSSDKIGLMTNEDDIILASGEIDFLRSVFGDRAKIYVKGGHCGNLAYRDNIADMVAFFDGGWPDQ